MRATLFIAFLLVLGGAASAIDVNPSKNTIPRSSFDGGGNRFTIFNGDPKRIQRANDVDPKSFDTKLEVTPSPVLLKTLQSSGPNPGLKIQFSIHNHAKKTYTLSFPTAQRWDFRISNAAGTVIYTYTDDHEFVQAIGSSMVNQDDSLTYTENVELTDMTPTLEPGIYKVEAIMANYPEMHAEAQITVQN